MADDLSQYGNLLDLYQCLYGLKNEIGFTDRAVQKYAMKVSKYAHEMCDYMLTSFTDGANFFELYWQFLLLEAPYLFESYMLYMEKNRSPENASPFRVPHPAPKKIEEDKNYPPLPFF